MPKQLLKVARELSLQSPTLTLPSNRTSTIGEASSSLSSLFSTKTIEKGFTPNLQPHKKSLKTQQYLIFQPHNRSTTQPQTKKNEKKKSPLNPKENQDLRKCLEISMLFLAKQHWLRQPSNPSPPSFSLKAKPKHQSFNLRESFFKVGSFTQPKKLPHDNPIKLPFVWPIR